MESDSEGNFQIIQKGYIPFHFLKGDIRLRELINISKAIGIFIVDTLLFVIPWCFLYYINSLIDGLGFIMTLLTIITFVGYIFSLSYIIVNRFDI